MIEQVNVMSAADYMQKFGVNGIGKGEDRWEVRRKMLKSMKKEVVDLALFRVGPQAFNDDYIPTDKERQKLMNILDNAQKKWERICSMFSRYRETYDLIQPKDLGDFLNEKQYYINVNAGIDGIGNDE